MVTFTINIPQMSAYIPYMDPMGRVSISTQMTSDVFVLAMCPGAPIYQRRVLDSHVLSCEKKTVTGKMPNGSRIYWSFLNSSYKQIHVGSFITLNHVLFSRDRNIKNNFVTILGLDLTFLRLLWGGYNSLT